MFKRQISGKRFNLALRSVAWSTWYSSRCTETHLIRTPHYYGQFALSLGKEIPYIFSKFNPLDMDTSLLRTVCFVPGERKSIHFR